MAWRPRLGRASEDGLEVGIGLGVSSFGAVQPLFMDGLQPGQELEAQQVAERKRHGTLPMTIDILAVHFHGGAVASYAFHHRGDFGRRTCLQLRVDARHFAIDMPIDHHARLPIPHMPFRQ
jgi:hypothetical protein